MSYQTGILTALKDWGLTVHEVPGWRTRGGSEFDPHGHVVHHDVIGDQEGTHDHVPPIIIEGRPDLDGPLANFWLERDGDVHLVAAGRANHAGEGGWRGLSGNASVWGTEMNNLGTAADPWPEVQLDAMARLAACTCEYSGFIPGYVLGHKEWTSRKIDPHTIDMDAFRVQVALQEKTGDLSIVDDKTRKYFDEKFKLGRDRDRSILTYLRAVRKGQGATDDDLTDIDRQLARIEAEIRAEQT